MNSLNDFLMAEVSGITGLQILMPALMKSIDKIPFKHISNTEEFKVFQ
jgi:hypothetical protein